MATQWTKELDVNPSNVKRMMTAAQLKNVKTISAKVINTSVINTIKKTLYYSLLKDICELLFISGIY